MIIQDLYNFSFLQAVLRNDVHILNVLCLRALKSTKLHLFYKRTEWPEWQMIKTDKKEYLDLFTENDAGFKLAQNTFNIKLCKLSIAIAIAIAIAIFGR